MLATLPVALRRTLVLFLAAPFLAPIVSPLAGQEHEERHVRALPQWEVRQDVTLASEPGTHLGLGLNVRAGYYVRVGAAIAAGTVRREADAWMGAQRIDLTARFLLDPFGERRRAWYGGGGVSLAQVAGEEPTAVLNLLVGLEGQQRRKITPAIELGVGGGVRLGVVLRRTRPGQAR